MLALDWNNDLRIDLLLAGAGGLRFLQLEADGALADVTAKTGLADDVLKDDYYGAWAADIETDGDLDIILAPLRGAAAVAQQRRRHLRRQGRSGVRWAARCARDGVGRPR